MLAGQRRAVSVRRPWANLIFAGKIVENRTGKPPAGVCEQRFGTYPVQVVHEWNAAVHVQDAESQPEKRAFTIDELQDFFDYADEQVTVARDRGRKGWLPAFRDATLFKTAYGYGLRRNETRMLDLADIGPNPHGPEFGDCGLVDVRHGKAKKGSPPKRRSVATVWTWTGRVMPSV